MKTRPRHKKGFTLIEVLVAIFVVGVAVTIFAGIVPMSVKTETMSGSYQQASGLLQHKIDELRAVGWGRLNYDELKAAGIIDAVPATGPFSWAEASDLSSIYKQATATLAISEFSSTIRSVTLTITWTGMSAKQGNGTITVTALIAKA